MKALACIVASTCVVGACAAPVPTVTELAPDAPEPGWYEQATSVSESGRIVGGRVSWSAQPRAAHIVEFLHNGATVVLPAPAGYAACDATAIANDGTIAGHCTADDGSESTAAFYWDPTRVAHRVVIEHHFVRSVVAMNSHGVMVVNAESSSGAGNTPYIYDTRTGKLTQLPELPYPRDELVVRAINDAGDVAGVPADGSQPVKWSAGTLAVTEVPMPPRPDGCGASVYGINDRGAIVGASCSTTPLTPSDALYWPSATALPETLPRAPADGYSVLSTVALGLNDAGFIVGVVSEYHDNGSRQRGLVWTPDRRVVVLGETFPSDINDSGLIVGARNGRAVRVEF